MAFKFGYDGFRGPAWLLSAALVLGGCASSTVPRDDTGFSRSPGLDAFQGCYKNCSNTTDGSAAVCLSTVIWPGEFAVGNRPEAVHIRKEGDDTLVASALAGGKVIKRSTFVAGKDFQFRDGRIELGKKYLGSAATEPGNPFIGVATEQTVLGLDREGQGRILTTSAFAGTAFLIVPVAGKVGAAGRIERVDGLCDESGR